MKIKTIAAWIFLGFGLWMIGALLYVLGVTSDGKLAKFLAVVGAVYFCIGVVSTIIHDRHMAKRVRAAGRE